MAGPDILEDLQLLLPPCSHTHVRLVSLSITLAAMPGSSPFGHDLVASTLLLLRP